VCDNEINDPEHLLLISGDDVCSPELRLAWWQLPAAPFRIPDRNVNNSNMKFDLPVHDVVTSGGIVTTPKMHEHLAQKRVKSRREPTSMYGQPPAALPLSACTPIPPESVVLLHLCATTRQDQFIHQENLLIVSIDDADLPELPQACGKLPAALYQLPEQRESYESEKFTWCLRAHVICVNLLYEAHYHEPMMQKLNIDRRTPVVASIIFTASATTSLREKKNYRCWLTLTIAVWCFNASQLGPTSSMCLCNDGTSVPEPPRGWVQLLEASERLPDQKMSNANTKYLLVTTCR